MFARRRYSSVLTLGKYKFNIPLDILHNVGNHILPTEKFTEKALVTPILVTLIFSLDMYSMLCILYIFLSAFCASKQITNMDNTAYETSKCLRCRHVITIQLNVLYVFKF